MLFHSVTWVFQRHALLKFYVHLDVQGLSSMSLIFFIITSLHVFALRFKIFTLIDFLDCQVNLNSDHPLLQLNQKLLHRNCF